MGEWKYKSTLPLTLALDKDGWSKPRPGSLYLRKRHGAHCELRWVGRRSGLDGCEKFAFTGIRFPNRPAPRETLYRLSYPGPRNILQGMNFPHQHSPKSCIKSHFTLKEEFSNKTAKPCEFNKHHTVTVKRQ